MPDPTGPGFVSLCSDERCEGPRPHRRWSGACEDFYLDAPDAGIEVGRASLVRDLHRMRDEGHGGVRAAFLIVCVDVVLRALDKRGLL